MTDEDLARIKPGSIIRDADGRNFVVKNIRKETPMYEVDEDISVAKLKREIEAIGKSLDDALASLEVTDSFENTARTIQKRDECSRTQALSRARAENPAAFERFQAGIAKGTPGVNRALGFEPLGVEGQRKAKARWDKLVAQVAADSKLSRTAALSKARQEYPDEFQKFQASV